MKENSFKQIIFDEITGTLNLIDDGNNSYQCNIYGERSSRFLPNITGFASFKQRKNYNIDCEIKSECEENLYRPQNSKI
jgi:hypothetical protein